MKRNGYNQSITFTTVLEIQYFNYAVISDGCTFHGSLWEFQCLNKVTNRKERITENE